MQNWTRAVAVVLAAAVFVTACAKKVEPRLPALTASEISAARLWTRITAESDWDLWASWPGYEGKQPGQSPHGQFHEIYIDNVLAGALPIASRVAPNGSIIVKENFDSNLKPTNVTVIAKVAGYDSEHGDWFWAAFDPDGKVQAEGKVTLCIDCHSGMKANDYVIVRRLDAPLERQ
jgi:hypothetical protein